MFVVLCSTYIKFYTKENAMNLVKRRTMMTASSSSSMWWSCRTIRSRLTGFDGGTFYHTHCTYLVPMLGWFVFSALLSSYNKFVFGETHLAFPCPLLLTAIHFSCQWLYSYILSSIFPQSLGGTQVQALTWAIFLGISIPCGIVAASDIGFSNLALVRITLTFYTMVKASTPIFVLLSAYLFGIARITWALTAVVLVIFVGELLTVFGEVEFDTLGFIFCTVATVMSGVRWTLVELKLRDIQPPLKSSVAVMRILSPIMFISMMILSLIWEKPWSKLKGTKYWSSWDDMLKMVLLALVGAFLAICMISCEFYLLIKSSAIVIMIGGVIKELLNIVVGVLFFHDRINAVNAGGCLIVFSGVILYKVSLIFGNHTEAYSPIDQDNETKNNQVIDDTDDNKAIDSNTNRSQDYPSNRLIAPTRLDRSSSNIGNVDGPRIPRLERSSSSIGNTDARTAIQGHTLDPIKTNIEIDDFLEEGNSPLAQSLQDRQIRYQCWLPLTFQVHPHSFDHQQIQSHVAS